MGVYLLIIASVDLRYRGVYIVYDIFWRHSGLCKFAGFLSTYSSELSVATLTVITVDRFFSIIFPFRVKRLSMRDARFVMALLWMLVFGMSAIPLTKVPYFQNFYGRSGVCLALHITPEKPSGWQYSVFVFLAFNFASFLMIFISYVWMFFIARKTSAAARSPQMKSDRAMARRMTFIVLTDFCCWIPIIGLGIASLGGAKVPPQVFAWIAVFVLPLNSAINPLLYTLSTAPFLGHARRRAFKFRKSFMSSLNPATENTTKGTTFSEGRYSPGNEWARPMFRSLRAYRGVEMMYMYPVGLDKRNGMFKRNEREVRKDPRHDSSTSADCPATDVICGYESDQ
ncbi:hypothetical protein LSH36_45g04017 [Paralvinella palmiformis]|uniref:G-protein coupled receptors family 1 profile domain-containing protein n=1 Tax=Paralvinella palmiformis TaxID=53620 RepID=A0AAD9NDA2_9ANNE|nr:hypothetical protein LSH36_45g04017 [Paralvinella palmiformis]